MPVDRVAHRTHTCRTTRNDDGKSRAASVRRSARTAEERYVSKLLEPSTDSLSPNGAESGEFQKLRRPRTVSLNVGRPMDECGSRDETTRTNSRSSGEKNETNRRSVKYCPKQGDARLYYVRNLFALRSSRHRRSGLCNVRRRTVFRTFCRHRRFRHHQIGSEPVSGHDVVGRPAIPPDPMPAFIQHAPKLIHLQKYFFPIFNPFKKRSMQLLRK